MKNTFEKLYPYLHLYVGYQGWIEIGSDGHYDSWLRLLDEGGVRLECDQKTLDDSFLEAESWAKEWMTDNYASEVKKANLPIDE